MPLVGMTRYCGRDVNDFVSAARAAAWFALRGAPGLGLYLPGSVGDVDVDVEVAEGPVPKVVGWPVEMWLGARGAGGVGPMTVAMVCACCTEASSPGGKFAATGVRAPVAALADRAALADEPTERSV